LGELLRLNLPAVVRLALPGRSEPLYASVVGVRDEHYLLTSHNAGVDAPLEATALEAVWGGLAVVPWKNYLGYRGIIPGGAPRPSVVVLKQLLWELGHSHLTINDHYDDQTRNVVREIQAKHGLVVDGLVGDLTKIVLYNEKEGLPIPHLKE
jgi:general secretion pathway protein A